MDDVQKEDDCNSLVKSASPVSMSSTDPNTTDHDGGVQDRVIAQNGGPPSIVSTVTSANNNSNASYSHRDQERATSVPTTGFVLRKGLLCKSSDNIASVKLLGPDYCLHNKKVSASLHSFPSSCKHRVKLEEFSPATSSVMNYESDWKMPLQKFTILRHGNQNDDRKLPKRVRRYYKRQDELITAFEDMQLDVNEDMENTEEKRRERQRSLVLSKASFVVNLLLLIGKAIAAYLSGSLAIISSVVDSGVDLVSGILMWWSSRAMKNRNPYDYPQGRTKLEPVSIVIISVVMSLASVQMIRESIEKIILYATEDAAGPTVKIPTVVICCVTVVAKLILFVLCRRVKTSTAKALSMDHRNDTLSNTIALICGYIGYRLWSFADPIGAIVISIYIIISWFVAGYEQIKLLTGHTARPDFLKKITWISLNHHPQVSLIDTVRAFHFGNNFLVEVDIVLPEEMSLRESHDIGESLQLKLERLDEVERAFVHLDYECEHDPHSEHKVV